jgi:signal transduction histidine kinase
MKTFELDPSLEMQKPDEPSGQKGLGGTVLLANARWFTQVRWIVAAVFVALASVGLGFPGLFERVGLRPPTYWPFVLAGSLVAANGFFILHLRGAKRDLAGGSLSVNIWLQIVVDLLAVTVLVHEIGSISTFIPFTYLFHIALACIFFPPRESLLVTMLSGVLYFVTVALEEYDIWPARGIVGSAPASTFLAFLFAGSAVFVWIIVWYFVSTLSGTVRRRDQQLSLANEGLIRASEEKTQQMLLTTHDLKAPFGGIESNIQVMKHQYWDQISDPVRKIVDRIDVRAQTLRERINAILLLGKLRSLEASQRSRRAVDLQSISASVAEELEEKAGARGIVIEHRVPKLSVLGDENQYTILHEEPRRGSPFLMKESESGRMPFPAFSTSTSTRKRRLSSTSFRPVSVWQS